MRQYRGWRVTITTSVGARGQDYRVSDEMVDEKGGLLIVLQYVPESEREWTQFLGRTARHDHPGQYAVILNRDDYVHVGTLNKAASEGTIVKALLDDANDATETRLQNLEEDLNRGVLMHRYTSAWWVWSAQYRIHDELWMQMFDQWVDLCETFQKRSPKEITRIFEELERGLPPAAENTAIEDGHSKELGQSNEPGRSKEPSGSPEVRANDGTW